LAGIFLAFQQLREGELGGYSVVRRGKRKEAIYGIERLLAIARQGAAYGV
jgi:hypothetical protein